MINFGFIQLVIVIYLILLVIAIIGILQKKKKLTIAMYVIMIAGILVFGYLWIFASSM